MMKTLAGVLSRLNLGNGNKLELVRHSVICKKEMSAFSAYAQQPIPRQRLVIYTQLMAKTQQNRKAQKNARVAYYSSQR